MPQHLPPRFGPKPPLTPDRLQGPPIRLVIFDCDGVLVDSEGPSNRIVAQEITKLGWPMTEAESTELFVGHRLSDIPAVIEAKLGQAVPNGWVEMLRARLIAAFDIVPTIPGAYAALQAVIALGLPFRVASNSSHEEMDAKFHHTGLAALVQRRQHSARDVLHGKPAPDVFLHAAQAEGIPPSDCVVIEDSLPGIAAARAAGMRVIGLETHGNANILRNAGAYPIATLGNLPALLRVLA